VRGNKQLNLDRPAPDTALAPKSTCSPGDYDDAPQAHQYCCKSHEVNAAERADYFADKRARGELNPEVWPPIVDVERFEIPGDENLGAGAADDVDAQPDGVTLDDVE